MKEGTTMFVGIGIGAFFGLALVTGLILSNMSARKMRTSTQQVRERDE